MLLSSQRSESYKTSTGEEMIYSYSSIHLLQGYVPEEHGYSCLIEDDTCLAKQQFPDDFYIQHSAGALELL